MSKATIVRGRDRTSQRATRAALERIQHSLHVVVQAYSQMRSHERVLQSAGVRIDRGGAKLLYKLQLEGGSMRVTSLAERLGVDAPTVTRKVQQLEPLGYVTRDPDPEDGRASRILITPAGQETVDRLLAAYRDRLIRLTDGWTTQELHTFSLLLERLADSLQVEVGVE
jgi:DNA-binding MarR family transcriptional regulator